MEQRRDCPRAQVPASSTHDPGPRTPGPLGPRIQVPDVQGTCTGPVYLETGVPGPDRGWLWAGTEQPGLPGPAQDPEDSPPFPCLRVQRANPSHGTRARDVPTIPPSTLAPSPSFPFLSLLGPGSWQSWALARSSSMYWLPRPVRAALSVSFSLFLLSCPS